MNMIEIVLGDWSHDGHGLTENFFLESYLTRDEIQECYKKGLTKTGVPDITKQCKDYEDGSISYETYVEYVNKLDFSFVLEKLPWCGSMHPDVREEYLKNDLEEDNVGLGTSGFFAIWYAITQAGNDTGQSINIVRQEQLPSINIGGYGLFWS